MSVWAEHVSAALLGTRRRPVPVLPPQVLPVPGDGQAGATTAGADRRAGAPHEPGGIPAGADPAGTLLDQAAVLTVRRRAGRPPAAARGYAVVAPAPGEPLPVVPPAAARRLAQILGGDQVRLLPEWLEAAAARGRRVPAALLPELLDRGRTDRSLRPSIARAAGRRGVWLALRNTDWAYLVSEGADPGDDDPQIWRTGTRNQRIAHLTRLRGLDPARARKTLQESWASEPAPDRAAFLATFGHGLSSADEEFLEQALGDRAKDVRQLAADLLAGLPGSAYGRRMAERARACVRAEERTVRGRRQTWIVVDPPHAHDEDMARDGIPFHPAGSFAPGGRSGSPVGTRAGWLREILARTPLDTWTALLGMPPQEAVRLPVAGHGPDDPAAGHRQSRAQVTGDDRWARDVHIGWVRAAIRQRDVRWARALLTSGAVPVEEAEALADLLRVLPGDERDTAAAALIRWLEDAPRLLAVLERIPGPWTGELADTVIELLAALAREEAGGGRGGRRTRMLAPVCRLADARLTPEAAPRLDAVARPCPEAWPLRELTDTLRFRHEMLQELG